MLADKLLCSFMHILGIKGSMFTGEILRHERRPDPVVVHQVQVSARLCCSPGIEIRGNFPGPLNGNVVREMGVSTHHPCSVGANNRCVKMYDLPGRMHARISTTCAMYLYRRISDRAQGTLQVTLDGRYNFTLELPAMIAVAIIGDNKGNPRQWVY